jgi:hypothetical protein
MAYDRIDPSAEIPQADLLEQQTPLDPQLTLIHTPPTDPSAQPVDAADRWEQEAPVHDADDGEEYPHQPPGHSPVTADALREVPLRLLADFAEHLSPVEIRAVVDQCQRDLQIPSPAALPEMVERLARQRLTDRVDPIGPGDRS